jgi:hypothetical protein
MVTAGYKGPVIFPKTITKYNVTSAMYNEACLHPTSLEPTFLFILRHVYDVFGLYRIPVYSGFGL